MAVELWQPPGNSLTSQGIPPTHEGDEAFADRVLQAAGEPPIIPRGLTLERVAAEVARGEGLSLAEMRSVSRGRQRSRARLMTAWLGREFGKISVARVATYYRRDTATLAKGLARLEEMIASDHALRRKLDRLANKLRSR